MRDLYWAGSIEELWVGFLTVCHFNANSYTSGTHISRALAPIHKHLVVEESKVILGCEISSWWYFKGIILLTNHLVLSYEELICWKLIWLTSAPVVGLRSCQIVDHLSATSRTFISFQQLFFNYAYNSLINHVTSSLWTQPHSNRYGIDTLRNSTANLLRSSFSFLPNVVNPTRTWLHLLIKSLRVGHTLNLALTCNSLDVFAVGEWVRPELLRLLFRAILLANDWGLPLNPCCWDINSSWSSNIELLKTIPHAIELRRVAIDRCCSNSCLWNTHVVRSVCHMELGWCLAWVIDDEVVYVVVVNDVRDIANSCLSLASALLHETIRTHLSIITTCWFPSGSQTVLLRLGSKPCIIITLFRHWVFCNLAFVSPVLVNHNLFVFLGIIWSKVWLLHPSSGLIFSNNIRFKITFSHF